MGLITKLFGVSLPDWVYEVLAAMLVAGILVAYGMNKERIIVKHEVEKQEVIIEKKVNVTNEDEQRELAELRAYRAAHPVSDKPNDFGLCFASDRGAPSTAQRSEGAAGGSVQPVPPGNSGVQPIQTGRPILGMLDAFAGRADKVSAALRRRQELEP